MSFEHSTLEAHKDSLRRHTDAEAWEYMKSRVDFNGLHTSMQSELFGQPLALETLRALARLVYELRDRLHTYDAIVSDDVGGRFPSKLLYELTKRKRDTLNISDAPALKFVSAGRRLMHNETAVEAHFEKHKKDLKKKVLLVTEYVFSGDTLFRLSSMLEETGLECDVAAVSVSPYFDGWNKDEARLVNGKQSIVYGKMMDDSRAVLDGDLTAVNVNRYKADDHAHPQVFEVDRDEAVAARKDVQKMVETFSNLL